MKEFLLHKYLGFLVRVNPRLTSTREHLVNLISRRLLSLKYMYVSMDGRVILLTLVLNVIHIFYLSFYKDSCQSLVEDYEDPTEAPLGRGKRGLQDSLS